MCRLVGTKSNRPFTPADYVGDVCRRHGGKCGQGLYGIGGGGG